MGGATAHVGDGGGRGSGNTDEHDSDNTSVRPSLRLEGVVAERATAWWASTEKGAWAPSTGPSTTSPFALNSFPVRQALPQVSLKHQDVAGLRPRLDTHPLPTGHHSASVVNRT